MTSTLKALLDKCTPAPWSGGSDLIMHKSATVAHVSAGGNYHPSQSRAQTRKANSELIAAARNELPGILAENEKLREALAEIKEIYIGSEGFHAETCPEAYLQMKFRETYDTACEALKEIKP